MNDTRTILAAAMAVLAIGNVLADEAAPLVHRKVEFSGFVVAVDERLLPEGKPRHAAVDKLERDLAMVAERVNDETLAQLRRCAIQIDLDHKRGEKPLVSPQYHPSREWLVEHGYDASLAKTAHFPDAEYYLREPFASDQPLAALHELAHGYHDQALADDKEIVEAWKRFQASGHGDKVEFVRGDGTPRHYALTNPQEFFAEMSESYHGGNDFFPFNAEELKTAEPAIFALMEKKWGRPKMVDPLARSRKSPR